MKFECWVILLLPSVTVLGLVVTLCTSGFYIVNGNKKIIKATSRELCAMILCGIFLAYLSVIFYIITPKLLSCTINRHGFNISVALIYAPFSLRLIEYLEYLRLLRVELEGPNLLTVQRSCSPQFY